MNKGTLMGFISSDIKSEDMSLRNGESMRKCSFNIACQRKSKNDTADFPRVVAFGRVAEIVESYFAKGKGICVEYHIQTGSYTNKEGKKIYQTDLVVDSVEFPPVKKSEMAYSSEGGATFKESREESTQESPAPMPEDGEFMNIPENIDDELPFRK